MHYPSSSPPPQTVKSSDGKVADDDLNTKGTILHIQSSDQAHAMSSVPKELSDTKAAAQSTRPPSGTRSASSRYSTAKGAAIGEAPRVEAGQTQLTRLGFQAPSSSLPFLPAAQAPAAPSSADATRRGPEYYSTDPPKTKHAAPVTPKKGNNGVHFDESSKNKENDNYYTPKQQDRPTSRGASSSGILKQTSSPARHTTSSPRTPKREVKKPNKLVVNMDEVQLYITYSRAYKELEARMANNSSMKVKVINYSLNLFSNLATLLKEQVIANDSKDELHEKWTTKRKDMELTREQNYRLKKLVCTVPAYTKALSFILCLLNASIYVRFT